MNGEQAQRCLDVGRTAFHARDYEKALRLFKKSNSMHASEEALEWIQKASKKQRQEAVSSMPTSTKPKPAEIDDRTITENQKKEVERIISCKQDYYRILKLNRSATTKEIKKAYMKLSRVVHPDKNPHPDAVEASAALNSAKSCLTDERSRQIYDATGSDSSNSGNRRPNRTPSPFPHSHSPFGSGSPFHAHFSQPQRQYGNTYTFQGNAEDVFRQFMRQRSQGEPFQRREQTNPIRPTQRRAREHRNPRESEEKPNEMLTVCFQLCIFLLFGLVMIFGGYASEKSDFSFSATRTFTERHTSPAGVTFFTETNPSVHKVKILYDKVEEQYYLDLSKLCEKEMKDRENAKVYSPQRRENVLKNINKNSYCKKLDSFKNYLASAA